jgi:hypothetical protein
MTTTDQKMKLAAGHRLHYSGMSPVTATKIVPKLM